MIDRGRARVTTEPWSREDTYKMGPNRIFRNNGFRMENRRCRVLRGALQEWDVRPDIPADATLSRPQGTGGWLGLAFVAPAESGGWKRHSMSGRPGAIRVIGARQWRGGDLAGELSWGIHQSNRTYSHRPIHHACIHKVSRAVPAES